MQLPNRVFIFTDVKTNAVLFVKESRRYDYFVDSAHIKTSIISSLTQRPACPVFISSFSAYTGIASISLDAADRSRCELLGEQIQAIVYLATLCAMLEDEIHKTLSFENSASLNLKPEALINYIRLVEEERVLALDKVKLFLEEQKQQILAANGLDKIRKLLHHIKQNVNLGVYSATNQERKQLDGRK